MKRFLIILSVISVVISGCAQQPVKQQSVASQVPHVVTVPAFAKGAVDAVGGEQAWSTTEVIVGECTAKFYKPDGTFYLTRQRHAVYPWSDSIRIYAAEPQGTFVWQLSGNNFTLLEGTPQQAASLPMTLCDPAIARAIWSLMASPASLATKSDPNRVFGAAVQVAGIWHRPLKLADSQLWYQNKESDILDICQLEISGNTTHLLARGYDYLPIEKTRIMAPTKIEIFTTNSSASELVRIIELDYRTLESVGF
ncbi:MAG: hypothetical protein Q7T18_01695 [Sedimentisphaerales bacterium]|nr:hypothetical protein [Sedimentisphaerales bacterium]